jgi:hypothetical protein
MLASWLTLCLAAAPVTVAVADTGGTERAALNQLEAAVGRTSFIDASPLWQYLFHPPGMFLFQDFEAFTAEPVAGWPQALNGVWTETLAHCRLLAGPPPYRAMSLGVLQSCGRRAANLLWQRYLEQQHATRVFVLLREVTKPDAVLLGKAYGPGDTEELVLIEPFPKEKELEVVKHLVPALVAGEGAKRPRLITHAMFTPLKDDPFAKLAVVDQSVTLKACPALPAKLTVAGAGVIARSLTARWAASALGTGPALACTVSFSQQPEDAEVVKGLEVVNVVLSCGTKTVAVETATGAATKQPVERATEGLLSRLAAQLCP